MDYNSPRYGGSSLSCTLPTAARFIIFCGAMPTLVNCRAKKCGNTFSGNQKCEATPLCLISRSAKSALTRKRPDLFGNFCLANRGQRMNKKIKTSARNYKLKYDIPSGKVWPYSSSPTRRNKSGSGDLGSLHCDLR